MKKEPVLIVLGGLWAVLNAALIMLNALGVTDLDAAQLTAIGSFVTAVTGLAALVIRSTVSPAGQPKGTGYITAGDN